jgi:tight adherence protein C
VSLLSSPLAIWAVAMACAAMALRDAGGRRRSVSGKPAAPLPPGWMRAAARVPGPLSVTRLLARPGDALAIERAGMSGGLTPTALARARAGCGLAAAAAALLLAIGAPWAAALAPVLAGAAVWAPGRWVVGRQRARRRAIVRELPDLLDLLGICVEAGMALDPALSLASERLGGTLGTEVGRVLRDLSLGTPRRAAYRDLVDRVASPELARTVGALLQAEELGAPLSRALQGQADALRAGRRQAARERAATAAPKIQLVVALAMVPAVLILVLGVLVIELGRQVGAVVG